MNPFWSSIGRLVFWITWPFIIIYIFHSTRTRILIRHGDMVLVTKAWLGDGKWSLPGGGMHRHETPLEGAQRELYEEAGLRLKDAELNAKGKNHFDHHGLVFNYYLFVAEASEQYPLKRQHFEIAKIAWVKATQLSMSNARPDVLEALGAWSS